MLNNPSCTTSESTFIVDIVDLQAVKVFNIHKSKHSLSLVPEIATFETLWPVI